MVNWAQPAGQVREALGGVEGGVDPQSWGRPTCFLASRHSASQSGIKSPPHPLGVEVSRSSLCTLLKNALSFRGKKTPSSWKEPAFSCSLGSSATHAAPFWVTQPQSQGLQGEQSADRRRERGEWKSALYAQSSARGTTQNLKEPFSRVTAGTCFRGVYVFYG